MHPAYRQARLRLPLRRGLDLAGHAQFGAPSNPVCPVAPPTQPEAGRCHRQPRSRPRHRFLPTGRRHRHPQPERQLRGDPAQRSVRGGGLVSSSFPHGEADGSGYRRRRGPPLGVSPGCEKAAGPTARASGPPTAPTIQPMPTAGTPPQPTETCSRSDGDRQGHILESKGCLPVAFVNRLERQGWPIGDAG